MLFTVSPGLSWVGAKGTTLKMAHSMAGELVPVSAESCREQWARGVLSTWALLGLPHNMAEFKVWACKDNQEEVVQLHPNCGNSQIQREGNIVYLSMGVWQTSRRIHSIGNIIVAIFSENTVCHSKQYVIWLHQAVLIYKPDLKITASNKPPPGILPESSGKKKKTARLKENKLSKSHSWGRHRESLISQYLHICMSFPYNAWSSTN